MSFPNICCSPFLNVFKFPSMFQGAPSSVASMWCMSRLDSPSDGMRFLCHRRWRLLECSLPPILSTSLSLFYIFLSDAYTLGRTRPCRLVSSTNYLERERERGWICRNCQDCWRWRIGRRSPWKPFRRRIDNGYDSWIS